MTEANAPLNPDTPDGQDASPLDSNQVPDDIARLGPLVTPAPNAPPGMSPMAQMSFGGGGSGSSASASRPGTGLLGRAYIAARIMETTENYARADAPLQEATEEREAPGGAYLEWDEGFWEQVFAAGQQMWGRRIDIAPPVTVSEWVPRVPGLYWKPAARRLREFTQAMTEIISNKWHAFNPPTKSVRVMGGVGTLRLPPNDDGAHIITLTTGFNASEGVPALVSEEVWDRLTEQGSCEGRRIRVTAPVRWQEMSRGWSKEFDSTGDIPLGYLMLKDPDAIEVEDEFAPVLVQPFSVMEYRDHGVELFDYVFAQADTASPGWRDSLSQFFAGYATAQERAGRYMLAAEVNGTLWQAVYRSPLELRGADPAAGSQLTLLMARVEARMLGDDTIDRVLQALTQISNNIADQRRISSDIGIEPSLWVSGGTLAETASKFMDEVLRQKKLPSLIEYLGTRYPEVL
jgi:hypothetical protein